MLLLPQPSTNEKQPRKESELSYVEQAGQLPLFRVGTTTALEALTQRVRQQRTIVIPVVDASLQQTTLLSARGIALINKGAVSAHIEENGTLSLNLMRSCTSWPSGVWIDPPYRRLPDGAPFGTMHGSHRFQYALVSYRGSHEQADITLAAQRFNHPPLESRTPETLSDQAERTLPDTHAFLQVRDSRQVQLRALKPVGFGDAQWTPEETSRSGRRVAARLWNTTGQPVKSALWIDATVKQAWRADLLERLGDELRVENGAVHFELSANETATLILELADFGGLDAPPAGVSRGIDPTAGDHSVSEYWLENLCEGVSGNAVLSMTPIARTQELESSGAGSTTIRVSNNHRTEPMSISLTIEHSSALQVTPFESEFVLEPGGLRDVKIEVQKKDAATAHRSLLSVSSRDPSGAHVSCGSWFELPTRVDELAVEITNAAAMVAPSATDGETAVDQSTLIATLHNHTDGPISGLAAWITPQHLWSSTPRWRERVTIPARGSHTIRCAVSGYEADSYALLKFSYGGRITYGDTVAIVADPERSLLSFDVDRVRLQGDKPSLVAVTARSISGLSESSPLTIVAPPGWVVNEERREWSSAAAGLQQLVVHFAVTPAPNQMRGELKSRGPGNMVASTSFTVSKQQTARRALSRVAIDGKLDEWDDDEFSHSAGKLGKVKTAVRSASGGLAFAMSVIDEQFSQPKSGATIWEGDSVQIALSTAPANSLGYGSRDLEFGAALSPNGPLVWCWYGGEGGATGLVESAQVAIQRHEGRVDYEFLLPRSILPKISLEPGALLGFSYIANDNDGDGYRGATEWTGGMTGTKDASLFGELLLLKE